MLYWAPRICSSQSHTSSRRCFPRVDCCSYNQMKITFKQTQFTSTILPTMLFYLHTWSLWRNWAPGIFRWGCIVCCGRTPWIILSLLWKVLNYYLSMNTKMSKLLNEWKITWVLWGGAVIGIPHGSVWPGELLASPKLTSSKSSIWLCFSVCGVL